jgi:glycosyltransferase involved in cell wall biosynthesis
MSASPNDVPAGVNVVGQFNSESGVGEAARALVSALDAAGVPVLPTLPIDASPSRQGAAFQTVPLHQATFPVTLSLLTAYETKPFLDAAPPSFLEGRRLVGLWWWEVELFPDFMAEAFAHVDAVWAGTRHIQDAFARTCGATPVELVRYPVRMPTPSGSASRASLGLPEGSPLFVTVFGFYSSIARKNPQGTIAAFLRAFPTAEPGGPQLVVKTIDEDAHPVELEALRALTDPHPHVQLKPGYLDRAGMDDLLGAADVVVSLHRAEGFGYTPAEAMALGRPVIATGYSGNLDYMDSRSAVLIDAPLIPIGDDGGPYPPEARWADPDLDQAADAMRLLARDPALRERLGAAGKADLAARFSAAASGETIVAALRQLPPAPGGPGWLALRRARKRAAALRASR